MTLLTRTKTGVPVIRIFALLCMAAGISACGSMTYPLAKCDGYSRRPLNRSMWQWEDDSNFKQKHADALQTTSSHMATAYVEEGKEPPALAQYSFGASHRPCEG